jgi:GNAT superfamily N-acetyltransferase
MAGNSNKLQNHTIQQDYTITVVKASDLLIKTPFKVIVKNFIQKTFGGIPYNKAFPFPKNTVYLMFSNKKEDKIIGMGCISTESPSFHFKDAGIEEVSYLYNFGILPEYRKKGYGRILFNYILTAEKKLNLNIEITNSTSIKFFTKMGCKIIPIKFNREGYTGKITEYAMMNISV